MGIGSGGPKRQPVFVHLVCAHLALLQAPPVHDVAPGEQSAVVAHVEAQSALVRHAVLSFVVSPWTQRLFGGEPPAVAAADAPASVSVFPLQLVTAIRDEP